MPSSDTTIFGWDIGGAHVKACRMQGGRVDDVAEWACPLWQGLDRLEATLALAHARWPDLARARHAVTMTGEMVDLFADRRTGVQRIAATLAQGLSSRLFFFAGSHGWREGDEVGAHWEYIASANWLATATHVARCLDGRGTADGILVDIGSTTTDLIAFHAGRVLTAARTDAQRLATGELVYHGVVRTPLCALAPRIAWRGGELNVMNEFFASTADVYRLTGELNPAHDLYASADNALKDPAATRRRLARMIGMDAHEASAGAWLAFAKAWRAAQVAELGGQLRRVMELHALPATACVVSAGCGDFLAADVWAEALGAPRLACLAYGRDIAPIAVPGDSVVTAWAQVCAPSVAAAALFEMESR